ncbi:hypothetical protein M409DRAFT_63923 [Zasmidium cellare ATCC 36951]|uniref:Pet127-domain-containing protein n=1 Tax=Zasmidium cellare ATCC 36951 TaxID=1080233 RepID=A0A6A6CUZ3_ZASCE|nr:uncharacterized protein M409DRAFT_63923 [Zasmidium cellare ATCC 36951]KAF2170865.1 hypothetical protein M409DRAFT_63923 [Zasmidium cellare ATCC 36951]
MLANVAHSPAWRSQGYVCLACRRQRLASDRRRHQRRFNSTETDQSSQSSHSWFDALNDISDDYSTKPNNKARNSAVEKTFVNKSVPAKKESTHGRKKGKIDGLRSRLDKEISDGGQEKETEPLATAEASRIHKSLRRPTKRLGVGRIGASHRHVQLKGQIGLYASRKRVDLKASAEPEKDSTVEESTEQPLADSKSQIIADLMSQAKKRADQRDQDPVNQDKSEGTFDEFAALLSSISRPAFRIRNISSTSTRRPWPTPSHSKDAQEANDRNKSRHPSRTKWQSLAESDDALTNASVHNADSSPMEKAAQAAKFDRPMTLVQRWLMNQKRTQPWGVTQTPETVPANDSAASKKVVPKKASAAKEDSIAAYVNAKLKQPPALGDEIANSSKQDSSSRNPESIGKILDDMRKRAGADQVITDADVASAVLQAKDRVAKKKEREVSERVRRILSYGPESLQKQGAQVTMDSATEEVPLSGALSVPSEESPKTAPEQANLPEESSVTEGIRTSEASSDLAAEQKADVLTESADPPQVKAEQDENCAPAHSRLGSLWKQREPVAATEQSTERELHTSQSSAPATSSSSEQSAPSHGKPLVRLFHTRSSKSAPVSEAAKEEPAEERDETPSNAEIKSIETSSLEITPLDIPQPPVPYLEYGLDRVLFNPGVYQLQDPASRVYNFDPYLQTIMPVAEFDFDALKEYKTSSQDQALAELAKAQGKKYIGSTSSMTSSLAHFHFLLSNWRPINLSMLTNGFVGKGTNANFTEISRAPSAIFLRWKDGTYAIDADKEYDGANVLMLLGKSMELLLTLPTSEYERYRKSDPRQVPEASKTAPESYQYTTMRDFLMRSQLDAYDPRLPGSGTFDLKTRAVVSVRMQSQDFEPMTGYEIFGLHGKWGSYEREYFDMIRATMLKYMLQARMGRMNGIFVAYHNVKRIFGFQYIPMQEMDLALHGQADTCLGDQEFKASLEVMNELFNKATEKFPGQSLRFHFETPSQKSNGSPTALHVFAEPMSEDDIDRIQNSQKAKVQEFERNVMGKSGEPTDAAPLAKTSKATDTGTDSTLSLSSTNSDADVSFLGSISSTKSDANLKPLFYATVIVQSKVNDETVPNDRPTNLKRGDKWEIDYIIKDYEITEHEWAMYEDCRARRKYALTERDDEDGADPESDGEPRKENSFIKYLKQMAAEGRAFRKKIDVLEAGKDIVRVDQPLPKEREKIDDLDDYMAWMYGSK